MEPLGTGAIGKRLREFRSLQHDAFLDALSLELQELPKRFRPKTLYVGGGTPTELPTEGLERVFHEIQESVDCSDVTEFSCEANPGTIDPKTIELLAASPVNRVSLGVQSFDDTTLELLGRIHDSAQACASVRDLRGAGITNLSIDLLFGLPRTSFEIVNRNLDAIEALQPEHVSWYSLEYEKDTALTSMRDSGHLEPASEDQTAEEYESIRRGLTSLGYEQYELFSFAKPGFACKHNQNYWQSGTFFGCGPSSYSHVDGERSEQIRDLGRYIHAKKKGETTVISRERLPPEAKAREALIIALRQTPGISLSAFERQHDMSALSLIGSALPIWISQGWIEHHEDTLRLLPEAFLISDSLFREIVEPEETA